MRRLSVVSPASALLAAALLLAAICAPSAPADDAPAAPPSTPPAVSPTDATKAATALAERLRSKDADERKKALDEAAKNQHALVTAALGRLLGEVEDTDRAALLAALVARTDDAGRKAAAVAIASRLERIQTKDDDYAERQKLIAALHDLAEPASLRALAAELGTGVTSDELAARLRAIANLPCKDAVEEIIKFRASGRRRGGMEEGGNRGRLARDAFEYAVGVDVGQDPDQMRAWWKEHEKTFDFKAAAARRAREGSEPAKKKKGGDGAEPGMKPAGT